ncbi:helix-turn-helix transcriptional regulator [Streptomyces lomondensis]|uniref:helix-turn-helix transcriptional regulator n=1 Tax=Streptomyces lomondensis TaxID=68229 RepID=UPI0016759027|nr:helix-turn-helix transcriptional regulator [Streptomyces lomondensis]MCF0077681.1 helix-turn-helix transcriptional regulator [Streptomyces lomondensis]
MFRTLGGGDLGSNQTNKTHPHPITELCEEGGRLYTLALRAGRLAREDADPAPCLIELALLHPDPDDPTWLRPVPPVVALSRQLNPLEQEIADRRRRAIDLAEIFQPFMALGAQMATTSDSITVLEGGERINAALNMATSQCQNEMLTLQPSDRLSERSLLQGMKRDRPLIERGVRIRTVYQHTARYNPEQLAYSARLADGKAEYRTIDELVERLIICDETVAFIPIRDDQQVALELRHPGIIRYLIKVFEFMWNRAVPLSATTPYEIAQDGITEIQYSIAKLLVEGHVDEAIARRLGMNVRTCRAHIAKLASLLGSGSRAQLGYLIAQSGILEREEAPE